jgi:glucokinase
VAAARALGLHVDGARGVFAAAAAGDAGARRLVEACADRLAAMIACAVQIVQPDRVVLGGGVSQAGEVLLGPVRAALGRYALASHRRGLALVPAALGERAGVVGAARFAAGEGR